MSWLERIRGRLKGTRGGFEDEPPSTPPAQWTVSGITFHTRGWQLTESSSSAMSWTAPYATMVLTRDEVPADRPPLPLTEVRNQHRKHARANGEDMVLVEIVPVRHGEALQAIYKRRDGPGTAYRGLMEVQNPTTRFRIVTDMNEGTMTGTREAMVNAMRVQCGEFALGPKNDDGSYRVLGLLHDAYDPAFDGGALNSVSDDERLDPLMPNHPLTRTRAELRTIASSLVLSDDAKATPGVFRDDTEGEPARGPRRQLSFRVARALFNAADRYDLFEESLKEEIASLGDAPSPRLAGCLLEMGAFLQMKGRPGNAMPILTRAEQMLASGAGDDAMQTAIARTHRAYALFKLGQKAQALPIFMRAIKVLEKTGNDPNYVLALSGACQVLAEQGDTELAREYMDRMQKLMAKISPSDGR